MIFKKLLLATVILTILTGIAACSQSVPTPAPTVDTIIIRETVEVEKPVEIIVTREIEKIVEKIMTVEVEKPVVIVETVEVEKEVKVIETVEVTEIVLVEVEVTPRPPTLTPVPTPDLAHPMVHQVLNEITYVQHHYDPEINLDTFTCASERGLEAVRFAPETQSSPGPRYVGPNCGDFPLWGANALFEVQPDGTVFLVPQMSGGRFLSPEGIEYERFTLDQALYFFETGDMFWTGQHGQPGRIAICDPRCEGS